VIEVPENGGEKEGGDQDGGHAHEKKLRHALDVHHGSECKHADFRPPRICELAHHIGTTKFGIMITPLGVGVVVLLGMMMTRTGKLRGEHEC
jgi:hypothetical protein